MFVYSEKGVPFKVVIVAKGRFYGVIKSAPLDGSFIRAFVAGDHMVEFYDMRYDQDRQHHGQFVTRYYIKTILDGHPDQGLDLDGGVPEWTIPALARAKVQGYLTHFMECEDRAQSLMRVVHHA